MLKPSFRNILLYLLTKYIVFYVFMMFKNNDFYFVNPGIRNGADLFYYLWIFLFLPVVCMFIFTVPLYFVFKKKNTIYFTLIIIVFLVVEYFIYTYFASQANLMNGLYNEVVSLLMLFIFFFRHINLIFKRNEMITKRQ